VDRDDLLKHLTRIATTLGRAIGLSIVAAQARSTIEDAAISAMDDAWETLAECIVDFIEEAM
jgi:hypothetical protein